MKRYIEIGGKFTASAVSLGCMRMGGLDEKRVDAIMDTALENGIDFFDHADIYGKGNAEKVFGEYLKRHKGARDKMILQTKCAIHDGQFDFSKEHILKSVDGSLSRLGVDYMDMSKNGKIKSPPLSKGRGTALAVEECMGKT